jgi:hypothetical protein
LDAKLSKGRPRKAGPRTKGGRLKQYRDSGTAEGNSRRSHFYRGEDISCPIKILFANGQVDDAMLSACERYAWAYAVINGRVSVSAAAYEARERATGSQDGPPERVNRAAKAALKTAREVCRNSKDRALLQNVCVYERMPRAFLPCISRPGDIIEAERLIALLKELSRAYGFLIDGAEN